MTGPNHDLVAQGNIRRLAWCSRRFAQIHLRGRSRGQSQRSPNGLGSSVKAVEPHGGPGMGRTAIRARHCLVTRSRLRMPTQKTKQECPENDPVHWPMPTEKASPRNWRPTTQRMHTEYVICGSFAFRAL